jgi:hypothetical protein
MTQNWIVEFTEDPETKDLLLPFPEDMLKTLDWEEGTIVCWEITTNGLSLKKMEKKDGVE